MLAFRVAEAEVDLRRVRLVRHQLLSQALRICHSFSMQRAAAI
jgi:hypothetical protein